MLTLAKWVCLLLLFLILYSGLRNLISAFIRYSTIHQRLLLFRTTPRIDRSKLWWSGQDRAIGHITDLLVSTRASITVTHFLYASFTIGVFGVLIGTLFFSSFKGVVALGFMSISSPYLVLRMRLLNHQLQNRITFLPALEIFYQSYVLSEAKNIRHVLRSSLEEQRMLYPMKEAFEQLYRSLIIQSDTEGSLRVFALTLGNIWAEHFVSILRIGLHEGVDVTISLKELILDMRRAERADQAERNRLLEIRIANFSPIIFMIVFLTINFKIDYQQSYTYYVISEAGREMLLDAIILIGASFMMGIYLSMRKI
jgi:hypothetical protein